MQINVRTHHVSITKALKEYVEKKMSKLERFFDNIQEIQIELDVVGTSAENERQVAMGTIWASGTIIRAKEHSQDMYATVDMLFEKLEKQIKRYKERLKSKKKKGWRETVFRAYSLSEEPDEPVKEKKRLLKQRFVAKPMDPEEAVIILDSDELDFLVFRNSHTEDINVIYPEYPGEYGLIEP